MSALKRADWFRDLQELRNPDIHEGVLPIKSWQTVLKAQGSKVFSEEVITLDEGRVPERQALARLAPMFNHTLEAAFECHRRFSAELDPDGTRGQVLRQSRPLVAQE